jgi:hypothetical protein
MTVQTVASANATQATNKTGSTGNANNTGNTNADHQVARQFAQTMNAASSSDVWGQNYNPDPNDPLGQKMAAGLAQDVKWGRDAYDGLGGLLDLDTPGGSSLTDTQRQQRLQLLIHDLGPDGTANLIEQVGLYGTDQYKQALLPQFKAQFPSLLQSTFGQMINDGSFSPQDAAQLMDSLMVSPPQELNNAPWVNPAWFATNLLGSIQGQNSAQVKIAAGQELINLAQTAGAGTSASTIDSAEASDLLASAAQDPAGYQPVIDLLNQMDSKNPGFMKSFAQDATLGMMNLSQSNQTPYDFLAGNGTAFSGMANLLNTLTGDSPTKSLALEAFDGITSAIASNPSKASELLTEENVLADQGGLRDALANTFAKYTPEALAAWSGAPGTHEVPNTAMQDRLMSFMGFELSPIGKTADANYAVDSIMKAAGRFSNYALGNPDAGLDAFFRAGLSGPQKQQDAANYAGMILGSAFNVTADTQAYLKAHAVSAADIGQIQQRVFWDWVRFGVDTVTAVGTFSAGSMPGGFLAWMQTIRSATSVPSDVTSALADQQLVNTLQSGNAAVIPAAYVQGLSKILAQSGGVFGYAESMFNVLADNSKLSPDVANQVESAFLNGVNDIGGTPETQFSDSGWLGSFYGGWNANASVSDQFSMYSQDYAPLDLTTYPG